MIRERPSVVLKILTVLCGGFVVGCLPVPSSPKTPESPLAQVAREAMRSYALGIAEAFEEAGLKVERGELPTGVKANQWLREANTSARQRAFEKLDNALNDELGGDRWEAAKARRLFQDVACGLRGLQ